MDNVDNYQLLRQTAIDVAHIMDGWSLDTTLDSTWHCRIVGPDDARVYLQGAGGAYSDLRRIALSVQYPDGARDLYPSPDYPKATVARERGAEAIAKAITTKLLPTFYAERKRILANNRAQGQASVAREAAMNVLKDAFAGARAHDDNTSLSFYGDTTYGNLRLSHEGDSVTFDRISSVTVEQAVAIAKIIRGE